MPYNNDLFAERKCVHVKIRTSNMELFRVELLKRKLSMQEVFDEVAALVAHADPAMLKILDKIVYSKNKEKMDKLLKTKPEPTKNQAQRLGRSKPEVSSTEESFLSLLENANPLGKNDRDT